MVNQPAEDNHFYSKNLQKSSKCRILNSFKTPTCKSSLQGSCPWTKSCAFHRASSWACHRPLRQHSPHKVMTSSKDAETIQPMSDQHTASERALARVVLPRSKEPAIESPNVKPPWKYSTNTSSLASVCNLRATRQSSCKSWTTRMWSNALTCLKTKTTLPSSCLC